MTDRTPTNDNATAGLVVELREDATLVQNMLGVRAADTIERLQARVAEMEAEREAANKRAERLHRRAQVAEGKMSRTARFLNTLISYYTQGPGKKEFWIGQFLKAAQRHSRNASGMSIGLQSDFYHRKLSELDQRVTEAKAEGMREAVAYLMQQATEKGMTKTPQGRTASYYAQQLRKRAAALAQSGGADPAQGKGDQL